MVDPPAAEPEASLLVKMACTHEDPTSCIPDTAVLTQLTDRSGSFRNKPRYATERAVSLILGELARADAYYQVAWKKTKGERPPVPENTGVRYATAGALRAKGFTVVHAPGRRVADNPHVSVCITTSNWQTDQRIPWERDVTERFESCFNLKDGKGGDPQC